MRFNFAPSAVGTSITDRASAIYCYPSTESEMAEVKIGEFEEIKSKLRQAQDENVKLQAVISDLTQVNKRWQRYNNDRQMYVQKLLSTIQDQQEQINNMGEEKAFPGLQSEVSETCSRSECKLMREELKKLEEKIELLEYQVKAHKDDWEAERNEKQQVVKDRDQLKMQHMEAIRELYAIKGYHHESLNGTVKNGCRHCKRLEIEPPPMFTKPPYTTVRMGSTTQAPSGPCGQHVISLGGDLECDGDDFERLEGLEGLEGSEGFPCLESVGGAKPKSCVARTRSGESVVKTAKVRELEEEEAEENACALRPREESYSQSSTVAMISPCKVSPCDSSASVQSSGSGKRTVSLGFNVQLPIVKSSSAPERRSAAFRKPPKCINSISLSVLPPQKSRPRLREITDEGVETQTNESITCPNCRTVFPPDIHIQFLDHFDHCPKRNV